MLTATLCLYIIAVVAESATFVGHVPQNTNLSSNDSIVSSLSAAQQSALSLRNGSLVLMINNTHPLWSTETMAGDRATFTAQGQLILYDEHDAQIWLSHTMQGADSNETHQLAVVAECAYIANSKMYVSWNTHTDGCDAYPVTGSYIACAAHFLPWVAIHLSCITDASSSQWTAYSWTVSPSPLGDAIASSAVGFDADSDDFYILGGQSAAPRSGDDFSLEGREWLIADNTFDFDRNSAAVGVSEDGTIYLIGGNSDQLDSASNYKYVQRLQDGEWENLGAMLSYRCWGANNIYTQLADMLYFIANDDASTYSLLKRFDLNIGEEDDSFEVVVDEIKWSCLVSWHSFLHVIGGKDTTTSAALGKTRVYDLGAGIWIDDAVGPVLNTARWGPACAVNNDKIYVLGGETQGVFLDTVEYTTVNMTSGWTVLNDRLDVAIQCFKVVVYGDFLITIGGVTASWSKNVADHFIVDTVQNTVTVSGELDIAMRDVAILLIGNVLLAFGGMTDGRITDTRYLNLGLSVSVRDRIIIWNTQCTAKDVLSLCLTRRPGT